MISRIRAACRTNEPQFTSVLMMTAFNGLACVNAESWALIVGSLIFWPAIAFLGNLIHPIPVQ